MLMSGGVMSDAFFILGQILSIVALCCGAWLSYANRHLLKDGETKPRLAECDLGLAQDRRVTKLVIQPSNQCLTEH
jgi:hypothetical protein